MVVSILLFLLMVFIFLSLVHCNYWVLPNRLNSSLWSLKFFINDLLGVKYNSLSRIFLTLFYFLLFLNLFSNLPMSSSPTLYYFCTASFSFVLWLGLLFVTSKTQLYGFVAHMMPYGAPMFLAVLLPVIEIFSQIIRPFTLMIRLSTNLSAGHIMLYMFSFFSLSSFSMSVLIMSLSFMLFILEVSISMLQAYIFSSLSFMYLSESL